MILSYAIPILFETRNITKVCQMTHFNKQKCAKKTKKSKHIDIFIHSIGKRYYVKWCDVPTLRIIKILCDWIVHLRRILINVFMVTITILENIKRPTITLALRQCVCVCLIWTRSYCWNLQCLILQWAITTTHFCC